MENDLIKIASYANQFEAELAKFKLEENDIYCFIRNELTAQLQFGLGNFEIMVLQSDKEAALKLIEENNE